jgi:aminotransferase
MVTTPATATPTPLRLALSDRAKEIRGGGEGPFFMLLNLAAGRDDVIRLGRGEPDIPTPPHIIAAAKKALDEGKTTYTHPAGLPELREAIARKLSTDNGLTYNPMREIIVTAGAQEALAVTLQTLCNSGDEVLLASPAYNAYEVNIKLAGGVPAFVQTYEESGFRMQPEAIEARITPRTKVLALVSPNNPTASAIDKATMARIADVVIRHNLVVISDELYEKVVYDGFEHVSIATFPGMWERTVVINGFSKAYSMTGFRVGYLAGPEDYIRSALEPRHSLSISSPTPFQYAALAALNGPQDHIAAMMTTYTERRDLMRATFDEIGVTYSLPRGGFYFFANIGGAGMDSLDFCVKAVQEYGLLFFPGSMYDESARNYIRISFLAPMDELREALRRFSELYRSGVEASGR